MRLSAPAGLSSTVRRPGTVIAGWGLWPFGLLPGWYGVSPCLTPTSPALMCLYHVERHGMSCPGISSFMWQRASYGDSFSTITCLLKRKAIWFVTSILAPLFALFSLTSSCALKGSYSAHLRRRLPIRVRDCRPGGAAQVFAPPGLAFQPVLRGELADRDPEPRPDDGVLTLAEIWMRSWHVPCGIISHGVLSFGPDVLVWAPSSYHRL